MQKTSWETAQRQLERSHPRGGTPSLYFGADRQLSCGLETRRPADHYFWDGLKRGHSPKHPVVIFQFTLRGCGEYSEGGKTWPLPPGSSFLTLIPSPHRYYLPPTSPEWTFFWYIVEHPFLTERIRRLRTTEPAVQAWGIDSPALGRAMALWEASCRGQIRDVWAFEELLFGWLFALERELHEKRYPQNERERLLHETRDLVQKRMPRPIGAAELADLHGMERTTFSRYFKTTTGTSPAAFVTEVRLEKALSLLRTPAKLEDIARSTGFADANHFCKVFRAHYSTSPGVYRKMFLA